MKYYRENYDIDKICPLWADYQVVQMIKPSSIILEIGCATGYIGKFLKEKRNCKMYGIEIDKEAAKLAQPYYKKIIVGDVEDENTLSTLNYELPIMNYFDYILCMNVLEHLKDPKNVLKNIRKYLKSDGYLIICVPNVAHWAVRLRLLFGDFGDDRKIFGEHGIAVLDETHLRFFTLKKIKQLIIESGYDILRLTIDPDKGIPKIHGLVLRIPNGWKILKAFYSIWPTLFAGQFVILTKPRF